MYIYSPAVATQMLTRTSQKPVSDVNKEPAAQVSFGRMFDVYGTRQETRTQANLEISLRRESVKRFARQFNDERRHMSDIGILKAMSNVCESFYRPEIVRIAKIVDNQEALEVLREKIISNNVGWPTYDPDYIKAMDIIDTKLGYKE